ncbi:MAG: DUF559 domain-containing protein [Sphingomicrobium sp.]
MQEPRLLKNARNLRNASTPFEVILWNQLKGAQLNGHKFRRQHVIDHAIVDFFCANKGLIVEVDGDTHEFDRDAVRDQRHATMGFSTIRFTNADVGKNMTGVLTALSARLEALPDRWLNNGIPHPGSAAPSPPSPEGERI